MFWQPFIDTQNLTIEQLVLRLWVLFALIVFININETSRVRIECRSLPIERAWHTYNMSFPFFFVHCSIYQMLIWTLKHLIVAYACTDCRNHIFPLLWMKCLFNICVLYVCKLTDVNQSFKCAILYFPCATIYHKHLLLQYVIENILTDNSNSFKTAFLK